jgi:hypothetical protein
VREDDQHYAADPVDFLLSQPHLTFGWLSSISFHDFWLLLVQLTYAIRLLRLLLPALARTFDTTSEAQPQRQLDVRRI